MSNLIWKSLLISPAVLGLTLAASAQAVEGQAQQLEITNEQATSQEASEFDAANLPEEGKLNFAIPEQETIAQSTESDQLIDQINEYSGDNNSLDQVTSASQLSDIDPFWFEAVQKMVDKYECMIGYPDGTFKGQRNITRYEFAAAVSRCMEYIEENIGIGNLPEGELATLRRLVEEFRAELATLRGRVDDLEGRVAFLEDNQFSTTTKLKGEVIFALTDEFGGPADNNTVFQNRGRLALETSFTGRDTLVTRLAFGNGEIFDRVDAAGVRSDITETTQTFNIGNTGANDVVVDWLAYYFPFGASQAYVAAAGGIHSDYVPTLNPFFEDFDGGNGALSAFASESPIYRIGGGAGAAVSLGVGLVESVLGPSTLTIGYLANEANDPTEGAGLFGGNYAALAQLNFNLGDRIGIGATYVHGYHGAGSPIFNIGGNTGVVGSELANFGGATSTTSGARVTNSYGLEAAFRLSDKISISGYGAYGDIINLAGSNPTGVDVGDSEYWTYGAGVAFSDFGKEGNLLGIFGGAQPYSLAAGGAPAANNDVPYHVEAFYKYQLNDNISVTPGVIWVSNPNQNGDASDAWVGTLRTTFTF